MWKIKSLYLYGYVDCEAYPFLGLQILFCFVLFFVHVMLADLVCKYAEGKDISSAPAEEEKLENNAAKSSSSSTDSGSSSSGIYIIIFS